MQNNSFLHHIGIRAAVTIGAAALAVAASPTAPAEPVRPDALQVIAMLQRQGDKVIVHRTGNKPLQMCTMTSIREIDAQYWWTRPQVRDPQPARRPNGIGPQLIIRTMRVEIRC
ncbi:MULTISPECIES: hypothetical protein [Mycobacteroides]|uniref:Ig-like domain-containing protein n=2 Tax=Mycobacteroides TaxID=670516 RepID=A0A1X0IMI7_9MYCO|nr:MULTISPECIES: hypothetical protein [Mycobacteroides]EUA46551.1 hypothetical protein I543_0498 [Mycobacteroides abscessus 21]MBE5494993.1 hypothetical protein [Mycobacteroides abscessus]ORB49316.1 hypothetical protein BST43_23625 [Mycobacteroides saopaulense]SHQ34984.1 Uncharacterised protein [Mycobacteroides abscessus subsp. abscessus]SHQ38079.1 Uncharacterised protein [Mycobacteroides abscessus subsp. abscessus]